MAGLGDAVDRKVRTYSQGMKQRLGFARALLGRPELLILDEPTNGLDPGEIREIRELISRLSDQGSTVLLSSHHLSEVEQTCTHVVVMNRGTVVADGTVSQLVGASGAVFVEVDDRARAEAVLRAVPGVTRVTAQADGLLVEQAEGRAPTWPPRWSAPGCDWRRSWRPNGSRRRSSNCSTEPGRRPRAVRPPQRHRHRRPLPGLDGPGVGDVVIALFRTEFVKAAVRMRTLVVVVLLIALPTLIVVAINARGDRPGRGQNGEGLFRLAQQSGLLVPAAVLGVASAFLLVVIAGLLAGDSVASDSAWGNLRYVLMRPVSRTRLLLAKAAVAAVLIWGCVLVVALTSLVAGVIAFGSHPVTVPLVSGSGIQTFTMSTGTILLRVVVGTAYVAFGFTALLAIGTFMDAADPFFPEGIIEEIIENCVQTHRDDCGESSAFGA